jgi:hypothetical protein
MNLSIVDYFQKVSNINIFYDNKIVLLDNVEQQTILNGLLLTVENSHEMPAYGVAIHNEVKDAITKGLWIELIFDKTIIHNEMPFDKLLIEVNANSQGFNLIRYHDNIYEGRCYYLSLNSSMEKLYNTIINIIKK